MEVCIEFLNKIQYNRLEATLAQLVEHFTRNEKVVSSILTGGSIFGVIICLAEFDNN